MRYELLGDLRAAVDSAIAEGTTLATFRSRFDATVAKHGWSYNGGRDWRTRVIYDTNLRQSYAAGRWQQLQVVKEERPYWRYRHSPASENPREQHVAWDGLILRFSDPWWRTHFPIVSGCVKARIYGEQRIAHRAICGGGDDSERWRSVRAHGRCRCRRASTRGLHMRRGRAGDEWRHIQGRGPRHLGGRAPPP